MSDVLTVVGQYDKIIEKTQGWYDVEVRVAGKQYPVKLSTKSSNLLDQVRMTQGKVATFTYTEKESTKTNPNSGKPYINRFLESAEIGGVEDSGGSNAGGSSDKMTKEEWNAKDRRDFRSRAWAQTISAFAHTVTAEDEPVTVYARLKPFQRKIYEDIVGDLEPAPPKDGSGVTQAQPVDEPPPYDDDDIPF